MHAADGKRIRKWNVKSQVYGEAWAQGDVIGSCVDLDKGEISFFRNGLSMGVAFKNVRTMQPALAYFPTVSMSYTGVAGRGPGSVEAMQLSSETTVPCLKPWFVKRRRPTRCSLYTGVF